MIYGLNYMLGISFCNFYINTSINLEIHPTTTMIICEPNASLKTNIAIWTQTLYISTLIYVY